MSQRQITVRQIRLRHAEGQVNRIHLHSRVIIRIQTREGIRGSRCPRDNTFSLRHTTGMPMNRCLPPDREMFQEERAERRTPLPPEEEVPWKSPECTSHSTATIRCSREAILSRADISSRISTVSSSISSRSRGSSRTHRQRAVRRIRLRQGEGTASRHKAALWSSISSRADILSRICTASSSTSSRSRIISRAVCQRAVHLIRLRQGEGTALRLISSTADTISLHPTGTAS